jgi:hypothetical protein
VLQKSCRLFLLHRLDNSSTTEQIFATYRQLELSQTGCVLLSDPALLHSKDKANSKVITEESLLHPNKNNKVNRQVYNNI